MYIQRQIIYATILLPLCVVGIVALRAITAMSSNRQWHQIIGQSNPSNTITTAGVSIALWQLVIVIVALLAVLLLVITLLLSRSRVRHQQSLEADLAEAERRARIDAQQIVEREGGKKAQQKAEVEGGQRAQGKQMAYEQPKKQRSSLVPKE